ncbi:MAG: PH domain-containing protein [Halolamina sp.]
MRQQNEWFRPEHLASLRNVYVVVLLLIVGVPTAVGAYFATPLASVAVVAVAIVVLTFFVWYNRAFERSAAYRLTPEEIQYRRGVWVKKQSEVPYKRVTNVTTAEGPIQRRVGAGSVEIHTAGRSAQAGAEMKVQGVEDFEDIKDQVMDEVRAHRGVAADEGEAPAEPPTAAPGDASEELLEEVRQIREILEWTQ